MSAKRGVLERSGILHDESEDDNTGLGTKDDQSNNFCNVHEDVNPSSTPPSADSPDPWKNKKTGSKGKEVVQEHLFVRQRLQDSSIKDTLEACQSHDNPAFQDDDGAVTGSSRHPVHYTDTHQVDVSEQMAQTVHPDMIHIEGAGAISELTQENGNGNVARNITSETYENGGSELLRLPCDIIVSSSDHISVDNVKVVSLTHPRRSEESKLHSRSISSLTVLTSTSDQELKSGSMTQTVQRSYSMRVDQPKARKLLRDLSFSDSDARAVRDYGTLRAGHLIPRREPLRQAEIDRQEDISLRQMPQLETNLMNLMQELLYRGKIRQVAVLAQKSGSMLASLPPWKLSHQDEIGLVKATTCTTEIMLKITVGCKTYTVFKHGTNKIVGRSEDSILVANKTHFCVVVGVAEDNIPGSCMYEVSELARALMDKGW